MGFWKKFKNKEDLLTKEQGEYIFRFGERVVEKLKLKERVDKINKYGNEKPQMVFLWIFLFIMVSFVIGYFSTRKEYNGNMMEIPVPIKQEPVDKFKIKMESLRDEFMATSDTLTKVMSKPVLTAEDSMFIMEKYQRLEEIDRIINTKFNEED